MATHSSVLAWRILQLNYEGIPKSLGWVSFIYCVLFCVRVGGILGSRGQERVVGTVEDGVDTGVSQTWVQGLALCVNRIHFLPSLGVPSPVWHEVAVFPRAAVRLSQGGPCPPALGGGGTPWEDCLLGSSPPGVTSACPWCALNLVGFSGADMGSQPD